MTLLYPSSNPHSSFNCVDMSKKKKFSCSCARRSGLGFIRLIKNGPTNQMGREGPLLESLSLSTPKSQENFVSESYCINTSRIGRLATLTRKIIILIAQYDKCKEKR
jgi:hypothetical protein